ncbi:MAG: hypothetical protein K0U98_08165 [Deltaproteobacteria bacterium]|nr:hypothetical protein [Deltaproteobacteria bacterium]
MEDLLTLDRYISSIQGQGRSWGRASWIGGGFYGLVMGLFLLWGLGPSWGLQRIAISAGVALVAGCLFGFLFSTFLQWWLTRMAKAIYRGIGPYAASPPPGRDFQYRLPCTWKKSPTMGVGGVLFIASDALAFVPHSRNLPRDRGSIEIPLGSDTFLEIAEQPVKRWQRTLFSEIPPILRLGGAQETWDLLVPDPEGVAARLRSILGTS